MVAAAIGEQSGNVCRIAGMESISSFLRELHDIGAFVGPKYPADSISKANVPEEGQVNA